MNNNSYNYSNDMNTNLLYLSFKNEWYMLKSESYQTIVNQKQLSINEYQKSKNKITIKKNDKIIKKNNSNFLDKYVKNEDEKQIDINKNNPENFFVNNRNLICKQIDLINVNNEITFLKYNVNTNSTIENNKQCKINMNYIKNKLRRKPQKMSHYYEKKFEFKNNDIFSRINDTLGNITNKRIPNNFLSHLIIIENNKKRNVLSVSVTQRIKSKVILLIYYSKG